jgi:hypothetical protein
MESYSGEIAFSGKAITIWGQGKVLDASGGGRFFIGEGAGSFLELHDTVLQNGDNAIVSGWNASCYTVLSIFPDFSLPFLAGDMQLKGGAINVDDGANAKIHDTIFLTNSATGIYVSIFTLREVS